MYIKIGYLPTFLKNNFNLLGKEKVFYILMNLQFEDKVYEMFISMFECKIKIKGLLLKIKDYKTKCKYFDMLPIYEQKRCIRGCVPP